MCCQAINKYANPLVSDYDPSSGEWVISRGSLWTKRAISASLFLISITALVCTLLLAMNSKEILIATSITTGASFALGCMYTALLAYVRAKRCCGNLFYDEAKTTASRKKRMATIARMAEYAEKTSTAEITKEAGQKPSNNG